MVLGERENGDGDSKFAGNVRKRRAGKMSDNYQAVYDAVRSRIQGVDMGQAAAEFFGRMDFSYTIMQLQHHVAEMASNVAAEYSRPSVVYRPVLSMDGDQWCLLYGVDLASGIAGFGDTPEKAAQDFDNAWRNWKAGGPRKSEEMERRIRL